MTNKLNTQQQNELLEVIRPFVDANKYNGKSLRYCSNQQKYFLQGQLKKAAQYCEGYANYRKDLDGSRGIVHDFYLPEYNARVSVVTDDKEWRVWVSGIQYDTEANL